MAHYLSILESVAELRAPVLQAVLTTHDIDADSARGTSIITDDRSSCRFSGDEEVSECICMYIMYIIHNATIMSEKSMQLCEGR